MRALKQITRLENIMKIFLLVFVLGTVFSHGPLESKLKYVNICVFLKIMYLKVSENIQMYQTRSQHFLSP